MWLRPIICDRQRMDDYFHLVWLSSRRSALCSTPSGWCCLWCSTRASSRCRGYGSSCYPVLWHGRAGGGQKHRQQLEKNPPPPSSSTGHHGPDVQSSAVLTCRGSCLACGCACSAFEPTSSGIFSLSRSQRLCLGRLRLPRCGSSPLGQWWVARTLGEKRGGKIWGQTLNPTLFFRLCSEMRGTPM